MGPFERHFIQALREDYGYTYRKDKRGRTVKIAPGYTYRENPMDGTGIAVGPCDSVQTDKRGAIFAVPKGYELKISKDGSGVVVARGTPTTEKNGKIVVPKKKPKTESSRPSCLELLRRMKLLAEG